MPAKVGKNFMIGPEIQLGKLFQIDTRGSFCASCRDTGRMGVP